MRRSRRRRRRFRSSPGSPSTGRGPASRSPSYPLISAPSGWAGSVAGEEWVGVAGSEKVVGICGFYVWEACSTAICIDQWDCCMQLLCMLGEGYLIYLSVRRNVTTKLLQHCYGSYWETVFTILQDKASYCGYGRLSWLHCKWFLWECNV